MYPHYNWLAMVGGNEVLFKDVGSGNRRDRPTEATRRPTKSVAGDVEGRGERWEQWREGGTGAEDGIGVPGVLTSRLAGQSGSQPGRTTWFSQATRECGRGAKRDQYLGGEV